MKATHYLLFCFIALGLEASILSNQATAKTAKIVPSQTITDDVFALLLREWQSFDFSRTQVKYVDASGNRLDRIPDRDPIRPEHFEPSQADDQLAPGVVLNLSFELVDYVKNQIVEMLFKQFENFTLPTEVSIPGLRMWNLHLNLSNLTSENVSMSLDEAQNCIEVRLVKLAMRLNSDIEIEKFYLTERGTVDVNLIVEELIVKLRFVDDPGHSLKHPRIQASLVKLDVPPAFLDIALSLDYIPNFLSDFIVSFIKGMLLDQIEIFLVQFLRTEGSAQLNDIIKDNYPAEVPIYGDDLVMGILMTQMIRVKSNRLEICVDGLAYLKSVTPRARGAPSAIAFSQDDAEGVVLGMAQEAVSSVMEAFFSQLYENHFVIESDSVRGEFKTNVNSGSFVISESGMALKGVLFSGHVEYSSYKLDVNFVMDSGLEINIFDFYKKLVVFSITNVDLSDFKFDCTSEFVESFGPYIKSLIEAFGDFFHNYSLPIPEVDLPYNIHLDSAKFRNQQGYLVLKVDSHKDD